MTESIRDLYFNPPRPSGALDDAHYSYSVQLLETCRTTGVFEYRTDCDFPDKTLWCAITTALPASLLPAYSAYASSAWSWWSAHSSSAVRVAQECPLLWYQIANNVVLGGAVWMNHTLINAECYAEAHQTVTGSRSSATGPTATPGQGATSVSAPASTSASVLPTQTTSVPSSGGKLPTAPTTMIMLPMLAVLFAVSISAICQSLRIIFENTTPANQAFNNLLESCNGGTYADGESEDLWFLCSYACTYGFCPSGVCKCTSYGVPGAPPQPTEGDGCPISGVSDAYKGLCDFGCKRGFCPGNLCQYC